jgi:hypothetical protein
MSQCISGTTIKILIIKIYMEPSQQGLVVCHQLCPAANVMIQRRSKLSTAGLWNISAKERYGKLGMRIKSYGQK